MSFLGGIGMATGAVGGLLDAVMAQQRASALKRALSGPTQAELQANQAADQAGGIARSVPGMAPAAASRQAGHTLTETSRALAPQRAAEEQQRALMRNQADTSAAGSLTRFLGALGGGLSAAGAQQTTSNPMDPTGGILGKLLGMAGVGGAPAAKPQAPQADKFTNQPETGSMLSQPQPSAGAQPVGKPPALLAQPTTPMPANPAVPPQPVPAPVPVSPAAQMQAAPAVPDLGPPLQLQPPTTLGGHGQASWMDLWGLGR